MGFAPLLENSAHRFLDPYPQPLIRNEKIDSSLGVLIGFETALLAL